MKLEGQIRIPSGCSVTSIFNKDRKLIDGRAIAQSIAVVHDRANGLGGGFAGYGIYPEYKDFFALHVFFNDVEARHQCEIYMESHFDIVNSAEIPTRKIKEITNEPIIWRYFVLPRPARLKDSQLDEDEYMLRCVFDMNTKYRGVFVFSSGKDMGVFKAVGYPEDVARFYRLEEYAGYSWIAHGRYPTNTPGWWGGAHPFAILNFSVVHNGEISSYDANRRFIEMFGYKCTLQTDTEVITYIWDYLVRRKKLSLKEASEVIAAPFWEKIATLPEPDRIRLTYFRNAYPSLLVTGPFSIIVGFKNGLLALNDRLKLRPMVVAEKDQTVYIASEECAIREISPSLDTVRSPFGGEPVIVKLNDDVI